MALSYQQWLEQVYPTTQYAISAGGQFAPAKAQEMYGQYVNAQQGAQPMWVLEDTGGGQQLRDVATGLPTQIMSAPNDPGDYASYEAFQQQAQDLNAYSGADFNDPYSQFWQTRYDPATTSWRKVLQENPNLHTLRNLAASGYFNRFGDFDAAANEQLGNYIADLQRGESDSRHFQDRSMLRMGAAVLGGLYGAYGAEGATTSAAAAPSATGAGSASATQAGMEGLGAAEGVGVYGGMDSAAIANADYGAGSAAAGGTTGGSSMWDFIDADYGSFDYGGEGMYSPEVAETGAFDQFGWMNSPDGTGAAGDIMADGYTSPFQMEDILKYGKNALPFLRSLMSAGGGGTGGTQGRGILDGILGDPLGSAFNMTPFLLALAEGNRQKNDIRDITNKLGDLEQEASTANVQSMVLNPYDRETAMGRERLIGSLGQRNVLGSSFGNQDLTAFDTTRMQGRGDLATKALMGSIGTRGALLDQVLQGTNKMNTNKNLLLGAGLNASGSLFQPRKADPFGLNALLGL